MTKKAESSDTMIQTETIKAALGIVSKALGKSALPVLTTIQMRAEGETLTLTATDLETAISVAVPAIVMKAWAACAPGTTLIDLASAAPGTQIDLTWEADSATLRFASQGTKAKLKSLAADEFPNTAAPASKRMGTLPASELRSALKRVAIAASADESRPALCAVQLALVNEKVCLTAADGFRLASYHLDHELVFHAKTSLLIPRSAALKLAAILPGDDSRVTVSVDEDRAILMTWGNVSFRTQLLDFNFPDWQVIFPTDFKHSLTLNGKDFQGAVRRAEIFAREGQSVLKFNHAENGVKVYGESAETGQGETILASDAEMPFLVGSNVIFVKQGLEAIGTDQVHMRLNEPNTPILFTNGTDKYRYVVMPVVISDPVEVARAAEVAKASEEAAAA